jgi:uncharacterized protein YbjT (DUF2867 family)
MRVLVLGGTGLIGSSVVARLTADGHEHVIVSRSPSPDGRHIPLDISRARRPEDWDAALSGIDAVVNAAGALQDGPGDSIEGVHHSGLAALFDACERRGVKTVVHLSAIGVDSAAPTPFSRTKRAGELALMARDLDWVVLRPSVVIGRSAFGGSALLRGLAALPILPELPDTAPIQPVALDDVVDTVSYFLRPETPKRQAVDLAGPRRMSFTDAVRLFRRWMRRRPAPAVAVPRPLAALLYRLGDVVHALGWRTPVTTTARAEMRRGAIGEPARWQQVTGIVPRNVEAFLMREPASVQERWFARLYVLKPVVFGLFGLFWIGTGLVSLGPGFEIGMSLLREGGLPESLGVAALVTGAVTDICIGCAMLYRPTTRYALWAALLISVAYAVIGTLLVPRLWSDPLGPMLKIWPVLMLNLIAMAIREDR